MHTWNEATRKPDKQRQATTEIESSDKRKPVWPYFFNVVVVVAVHIQRTMRKRAYISERRGDVHDARHTQHQPEKSITIYQNGRLYLWQTLQQQQQQKMFANLLICGCG